MATYKVPIRPVISASPIFVSVFTDAQQTKNPNGGTKGPIGVAVDGVAIFSDADALDRDAVVYEGSTFNPCGGHATPSGQYHYHVVPSDGCATSQVAGEHSPFWGLMADGIPIAGKLGDGGVLPTDLDECGGHVDSTYPVYHYHGSDSNPYTIRCLRGCIPNGTAGFTSLSSKAGACTPADTQYDYSSMMDEVNWVNGTFEATAPASDPSPTPSPKPSDPTPNSLPKPSDPTPNSSPKPSDPTPTPSPSGQSGSKGKKNGKNKKSNGKSGRRSLRQRA